MVNEYMELRNDYNPFKRLVAIPRVQDTTGRSIEQCENELIAIGFSSDEIKELNGIIKTIIEQILGGLFSENNGTK